METFCFSSLKFTCVVISALYVNYLPHDTLADKVNSNSLAEKEASYKT